MSASKIYRSIDISAPVMIKSTGGLNVVLEAVLVNGYGGKESLGWTKEYEDASNNTVVYRNKGTGYFLKIRDNILNTRYDSGCQAEIEVFEIMSDVNTGHFRCPEVGSNHNIQYAQDINSSDVINWVIIGDDKGFYLICPEVYGSGDHRANIFYLGDYIPFHLENKSNWLTVAYHLSSSNAFYNIWSSDGAYLTDTSNRIIRNHENIEGSRKIGLLGLGNKTILGQLKYNSPITILNPIYIHETANLIGQMPGLFEPITNQTENYDIVKHTQGGDVYFWDIYASTTLGILAGEGFRP